MKRPECKICGGAADCDHPRGGDRVRVKAGHVGAGFEFTVTTTKPSRTGGPGIVFGFNATPRSIAAVEIMERKEW